jgi:hypothetical protein
MAHRNLHQYQTAHSTMNLMAEFGDGDDDDDDDDDDDFETERHAGRGRQEEAALNTALLRVQQGCSG